MDTTFFEHRGVDMDTEIFENRGVDMDMDTEFSENRGVDMDMDTAWNRCPPNSGPDHANQDGRTCGLELLNNDYYIL